MDYYFWVWGSRSGTPRRRATATAAPTSRPGAGRRWTPSWLRSGRASTQAASWESQAPDGLRAHPSALVGWEGGRVTVAVERPRTRRSYVGTGSSSGSGTRGPGVSGAGSSCGGSSGSTGGASGTSASATPVALEFFISICACEFVTFVGFPERPWRSRWPLGETASPRTSKWEAASSPGACAGRARAQ
jgi:hypothetical protein